MDKIPKKGLDIQQILDKIKTLPIDDTDKATILEEIKKNITHPSAGENQNLDNIQSKYTKMNMPNMQQENSNYRQAPNFQQMHQQFNPNNNSNSNSNPNPNPNLNGERDAVLNNVHSINTLNIVIYIDEKKEWNYQYRFQNLKSIVDKRI